MGTCATTASIPEQPLSLTPEEESKAYDTIFTAIVNAALDMYVLSDRDGHIDLDIVHSSNSMHPCGVL